MKLRIFNDLMPGCFYLAFYFFSACHALNIHTKLGETKRNLEARLTVSEHLIQCHKLASNESHECAKVSINHKVIYITFLSCRKREEKQLSLMIISHIPVTSD